MSDQVRPLLRVVRGDVTPQEIAAMVAVIAAIGQGREAPGRRPAPVWTSPHRQVRRSLPHGPGGWRASALPR